MARSYRRGISVRRVPQYVACALFILLCAAMLNAQSVPSETIEHSGAAKIKTVFVIAMENHNWTQPENKFTGGIQQVYQNVNAPFINNLVNGTAFVVLDGSEVNISHEVAYATAYHNVLATPSGNNPHIHPSEPSYI